MLSSINIDSSAVFELYEIGGPVVALLLILSLIAMTISLVKTFQFIVINSTYKKKCLPVLQSWKKTRDISSIRNLTEATNPICKILCAAIKGASNNKIHGDRVNNEITRIAKLELNRLRSNLKTLEIIASMSPLLGLLGTVLGMIEAFQQLQTAGNQVDPSILSGGIWEALLTTAVGLCVAIPTLIIYTWLDKKVDFFRLTMEDYVTRVLSSDAHFVMNLPYKNKRLAAAVQT